MTDPSFAARLEYSDQRLRRLRDGLADAAALRDYGGLAVFTAGSYGRGEASEHSDIDLFLLHNEQFGGVTEPHLRGIRVMSAIIRQLEDGDSFPLPSNDGQFFHILSVNDILENLGGPQDDYMNYFTTRMLLLLKCRPVFGEPAYQSALERVIESYFRDYSNHTADFRTTFLANDIIRFWKTLCLNYEHKRNKKDEDHEVSCHLVSKSKEDKRTN